MSKDSTIEENQFEIKDSDIISLKRDTGEQVSSWKFFMGIIIIGIVGFSAILVMQNNPSVTAETKIVGENLELSLTSLSSKAKFFHYDSDNVRMIFFAVMGSDNGVHLALDACDVCYAERKGYRQQGELMVCINCNNKFLINGIGTENIQGGCWPSYMPITIEDNQVIIKISNMDQKRYMFQ